MSPKVLGCVQAMDYGVMLKLNDSAMAVKHLHRMLQLLIVLSRGKSNTYAQSVLMQCLFTCHQRKHRLPVWTMFKRNMACFNEEAGEISFSMLSRSARGDTCEHYLPHLQKLYLLLHAYASVEAMIKRQQAGDRDSEPQNWRKRLDPAGTSVQETGAVVRGLLRQIKTKAYKVYPGTKPEYNKKSVAMCSMSLCTKKASSFFDVDFAKGLEVQVDKCKERYFRN